MLEFPRSHTCNKETMDEWCKIFKQDCPSGWLTPSNFVGKYKTFVGPTGNAEQFCDHNIRSFDIDKNGFIELNEFLLIIVVVVVMGTREEKLTWAFRLYDSQ